MLLDESIAKYVLKSIVEKETYRELTIEDRHVRSVLQESFPKLQQEIEQNQFTKWVWSTMVNGETSVVRAAHDVDTLVGIIQRAQDAHCSSLESDCLQEELSEKLDVLHALKWRVFDRLLGDAQMQDAMKRKFLEVSGKSDTAPEQSPPALGACEK
jgi:hypothetical protein